MLRSTLVVTLLVLAPSAAAPGSALAVVDETVLVSRQSETAGGGAGDDDGARPSISADGRFIAFESGANNLSPDDDNGAFTNIFVRDTASNATALISRQTGAAGTGADVGSYSAAISGDGRYVAFASDATNLSVDEVAFANVYVRDTVTNVTTLVSRESGASGPGADGDSTAPSISVDGRYIAFLSDANNLSAGDDNAELNVFVRDTVANTTTLVSRATGAAGAGADDGSGAPSISGDGRHVSFASHADNLSASDDNLVRNVFVRDTTAGTTTLVSRQTGATGAGGDGDSSEPAISGDGRHVSFTSEAGNLGGGILVRDTTANVTTLVSRQTGPAGAPADGGSGRSSISADGRVIAFESSATNLGASDDAPAVLTRDTTANTTSLVSRQSAADGGAAGNAESREATISADGQYVAFSSSATNLSALDADAFYDVFRRPAGDVPPGPVIPGPQAPVGGGPTAPSPQPIAAPVAVPAKLTIAAVVTLPGTRTCRSRRTLTIRLRAPAGRPLASVKLVISARNVASRTRTVTGRKLTAPVNLVGLPKGRYTVKITVRLRDGTSLTATRAYRTCTPKKKR